MLPITPQTIDDICLYKFIAMKKIDKLCSDLHKAQSQPLNKTASSNNGIIDLFMKMLTCLNIKSDERNINNVINNLAQIDTDALNKTAMKQTQDRKEEIKIASKNVKDSHYQIDVSKDTIVRKGQNLFMVSCYARDAYLGRYLIKRNFLYTTNREKSANEAFDEIITKVAAIKDRYYQEIIETPQILSQIRQVLDGVVSEIKMEEDSIATNINRQNAI